MEYILYGAIGALLTVALFSAGVYTGWRVHIRYAEKTAAVVHTKLTEEEKKRQREDAQAFDQLVNYSPEMAYGLHRAEDIYDKG